MAVTDRVPRASGFPLVSGGRAESTVTASRGCKDLGSQAHRAFVMRIQSRKGQRGGLDQG